MVKVFKFVTVGELMEALSGLDKDALVYAHCSEDDYIYNVLKIRVNDDGELILEY